MGFIYSNLQKYRGRERVSSRIEEKIVNGEEKSTERSKEEEAEDDEKHEPR